MQTLSGTKARQRLNENNEMHKVGFDSPSNPGTGTPGSMAPLTPANTRLASSPLGSPVPLSDAGSGGAGASAAGQEAGGEGGGQLAPGGGGEEVAVAEVVEGAGEVLFDA